MCLINLRQTNYTIERKMVSYFIQKGKAFEWRHQIVSIWGETLHTQSLKNLVKELFVCIDLSSDKSRPS